MNQLALIRLVYCLTTLLIFSAAVFALEAKPTWYVLMVALDVLFYAYTTPYKSDIKADGR